MPSLFKPIVAVLCLVFALCFTAPNAHADSYTATFTCNGTCASLPTATDVSFPAPFTIDITAFGATTVIVSGSGDLPGDTYTWHACDGCNGSFSAGFADLTTGDVEGLNSATCSQFATCESGSLTFAAVATPEPSSLALILSGVGMVFAMRKRSSGLQLAS